MCVVKPVGNTDYILVTVDVYRICIFAENRKVQVYHVISSHRIFYDILLYGLKRICILTNINDLEVIITLFPLFQLFVSFTKLNASNPTMITRLTHN